MTRNMSDNHIGTNKFWSPSFYGRLRLGVGTELYLVCKQQEIFMSKYIASIDSGLRHRLPVLGSWVREV